MWLMAFLNQFSTVWGPSLHWEPRGKLPLLPPPPLPPSPAVALPGTPPRIHLHEPVVTSTHHALSIRRVICYDVSDLSFEGSLMYLELR